MTYQLSALLTDIKHLLDKRCELRARVMDALHSEGTEIVSPSFMNTRAQAKNKVYLPPMTKSEPAAKDATSPDATAFDKARDAALKERKRSSVLAEKQSALITRTEQRISKT